MRRRNRTGELKPPFGPGQKGEAPSFWKGEGGRIGLVQGLVGTHALRTDRSAFESWCVDSNAKDDDRNRAARKEHCERAFLCPHSQNVEKSGDEARYLNDYSNFLRGLRFYSLLKISVENSQQRERQTLYLFLNFAGRFSTKAAMPSF